MTTTNNTSAPPLDLAAIEARHAAAQWPARMAVHDDGDVTVWEAGGDESCEAIAAEVRALPLPEAPR